MIEDMSCARTSSSDSPFIRKTIYLIRHAESEENRRLECFTRSIKGLVSFQLPSKGDVQSSMQLLNISAQIDSHVSPLGQRQISQLRKRLDSDAFIEKMGIQMVVHSPLLRARQTSEGMLDSVSGGNKHTSISRVVELDILKEKTPMEWLPMHKGAFARRIFEFEKWLMEQPEDVIAVVGHSQYFKSLLGLPKKFKNCDVWSLELQCPQEGTAMTNDASFPQEDVMEENQESEKDCYEIDGLRLDSIDLPRGWRALKRHYTFDHSLEE